MNATTKVPRTDRSALDHVGAGRKQGTPVAVANEPVYAEPFAPALGVRTLPKNGSEAPSTGSPIRDRRLDERGRA